MTSNMTFSYDSKPILTITNEIKNNGRQGSINLQPSYQRGFVWENDFKDKLIYSIVRQYPIGNVNLRANNSGVKEVVDGQQRLTTIYNFVNNDYTLKGEYAKKIVNYIIEYMKSSTEQDDNLDKLKQRLNNKTGITLKFSQLPTVIQQNIQSYNISITNISNASDLEIREFFRFLQNQERLRAGEIIKSFPSTDLELYLDRLNDLELFLQKINFTSNLRHEFDKHFYSVIGLLAGKINYGVTDQKVMDFALNADASSFNNTELIENMINNINLITSNDNIKQGAIENSNVRSTKYLLLLCAFNKIDFTIMANDKLNNLSKLNQKFSSFNSAKEGKEDEVFKGYKEEVKQDLRNITLLSKGSHNFERVEPNIEKLAFYVNNFDSNISYSPFNEAEIIRLEDIDKKLVAVRKEIINNYGNKAFLEKTELQLNNDEENCGQKLWDLWYSQNSFSIATMDKQIVNTLEDKQQYLDSLNDLLSSLQSEFLKKSD